MRIDIEDAGKQLAKLGSYAQIGEKVVITKDGEPYVELVPCPEYQEKRKKKPRVPGAWKGKVWMAPDFDEPLFEIRERRDYTEKETMMGGNQ
ncbi:MAG: DUF2281 domain-containing protein [Dehalococcoidia bacterium]|nr:DUF2281 domain-containing protein [Dehalococcoidia bacterium]